MTDNALMLDRLSDEKTKKLYLETHTVETESEIQRKFTARDNQNLVDRFAKPHERNAYMERWQAACCELASLRGRSRPVFDLQVDDRLAALVAEDRARSASCTRVLGAHVNLTVWRDKYGRMWRRKH